MSDKLVHTPWELVQNPWAVREEVLPSIAAFLRGASSDVLAERRDEDEQADQARIDRPCQLHGGVAVISLRGLIMPGASLLALLMGGGGLQIFRSQLREAVASDEVASILIDVDSPGGYLDLVPETAAEIRAAREEKPVVAVANTSAASAAYWLASQATEVVVTPSGSVGSIGVFTMHSDWSKYDEELGVKTTLIKAGKYKTEANPYEPLSEEAEAFLQERVNESLAMFHADVAKGRNATTKVVGKEFGEGRMLRAKDAVKVGMADRVDTFEGALIKLARRGGRSAGGRKGLQLMEHITSVTADVDEVSTRVADAVAQRADKGQQLAEATRESAAELQSSIERLREALAIEPRNEQSVADEAQELYLRHVARDHKGGSQ
jgi:capsid assembly protease